MLAGHPEAEMDTHLGAIRDIKLQRRKPKSTKLPQRLRRSQPVDCHRVRKRLGEQAIVKNGQRNATSIED